MLLLVRRANTKETLSEWTEELCICGGFVHHVGQLAMSKMYSMAAEAIEPEKLAPSHSGEGRFPQAGTPEIAIATHACPCGIGRRNGKPWGRLITTVGMLTPTGPLGTAQAGLPTEPSTPVEAWDRDKGVAEMPMTRSQSAGVDNAAHLEEVETSATSGSSEVRELRGQLAALTDLVAQQTATAQ
uniref:Uncharacterized protein n=1 Tax=Ananas comosus var. bracteatus TaxID=296719 RepID=A0A6V7PPE4_ANACO|nr:unnamed protein product [Ananas comosus var. bracteatus]